MNSVNKKLLPSIALFRFFANIGSQSPAWTNSTGPKSGQHRPTLLPTAFLPPLFLFAIATVFVFASSTTSFAQSAHHKRFVEALKQEGYFEVAESYLVSSEKSKWLGPEDRQLLPLQRSSLLFARSKQLRNISQVLEKWNQAEKLAKDFLASANTVDTKLAAYDLLRQIEEGRIAKILQKEKLDRTTIWKKQEAAKTARIHFQNAASYYGNSSAVLRQNLLQIRKSKNQKIRQTFAEKSQQFLRFLLLEQAHRENVASTFPPDSPERTQRLTSLVSNYEQLAKKYYSRPPYNEYFRAYKGRCLTGLKEWKKGAKELEDVLLRTEPSYIPLQKSIVPLVADCWANQNPPVIDPAITHLETLLARIGKEDQASPSSELVVYHLAKIHRQRIDLINKKSKLTASDRSAIRKAEKEGDKLLALIAKSKSPAGKMARDLILASGGKIKAIAEKAPENFKDAFAIATEKFRAAVRLSKTKSTKDPLSPQLNNACDQAITALDLANRFVNSDTSKEDQNLIRYYFCYSQWLKRRYPETALMGQYMLKHFPDLGGTKESASLATQALHRQIIQGQKAKKDVSFEQQRLTSLCQQILDRWPNSDAAGDVSFLMLTAAIGQKDLTSIRQAVSQIPATHPKYSTGQLFAGLTVYSQASAMRKQAGPKPTAETKKQIDAIQIESYKMMENGLSSLTGNPTANHFDAANRLAGHYNSQKQYAKAWNLLNGPPLSTYDRFQNGSLPKVSAPLKIYLVRNGLISQLEKGIQNSDPKGSIENFKRVYGLLKTVKTDDAQSVRYLRSTQTATILRIGNLAKATSKSADLLLIGQACLQQFGTMPAELKDFRVLGVLGGTLQNVSDGLDSGQIRLKRDLNQLAAKCYDKCILLSQSSVDGKKYLLQFQLGKASTLRGGGRYSQAAKEVEKILSANPRLAPAQIEACKIYQKWGEQTQNASYIAIAMKGGMERRVKGKRQRLMQGWQKLAQATIGSKKNQNTFFTAFIGLAECQLTYGTITKNSGFYKSVLKQVRSRKKKQPDLGGPMFKGKIDSIVRKAQKLLGQKQSGLKGLSP